MSEKNCPECGQETSRWVYKKNVDRRKSLVCRDCGRTENIRKDGILHRYENPWNKKLSYAKEKLIERRVIGPSGKVIDYRTGRPPQR